MEYLWIYFLCGLGLVLVRFFVRFAHEKWYAIKSKRKAIEHLSRCKSYLHIFHWHLSSHIPTHTAKTQPFKLRIVVVWIHITRTSYTNSTRFNSNRLDTQWGILILHNKWVITENISFFAAAAANERSATMQACDTKCVCLSSFCPPLYPIRKQQMNVEMRKRHCWHPFFCTPYPWRE